APADSLGTTPDLPGCEGEALATAEAWSGTTRQVWHCDSLKAGEVWPRAYSRPTFQRR
ncbi:MAG: hypothetical protein RLZZ387_3624, partial [Chloroflexota bacterium]